MLHHRLAPLLVIILLGTVACKKEQTDTLKCKETITLTHAPMSVAFPLDYLPARPGSWWTYSDGSTITTSATYIRSMIYDNGWDGNSGLTYCCPRTVLWLPTYNGAPLYGYTRMLGGSAGSYGGTCCQQLLSEKLGDVYRWGGNHYGRTTLKTMAVDTTLTLASGTAYADCIMVKRVEGIASNYFDQANTYYLTFYAPGVGMVKEEFVSTSGAWVRELVDHWIAP